VPEPEQADLEALLRSLAEAGVDFIVIGGTAAVLHGAPTTTLDLDIVHSLDTANLDRLERLLAELGAIARDPGGRRLPPERSHLEAGGQLRLLTRLGPLDLLGRLADGRGYDQLADHTVLLEDVDLRVRVLDLETLIEVKRHVGRARDRLHLSLLLALQEERDNEG